MSVEMFLEVSLNTSEFEVLWGKLVRESGVSIPMKALAVYLITSFGAAYALDIPLVTGAVSLKYFRVEASVRMWVPFLGAVIALLACGVPLREGLKRLGVRLGRLAYLPLGLITPYIIYLVGAGVCYLMGYAPVNPVEALLSNPQVPQQVKELILRSGPEVFLVLQLVNAAVAGLTINAALALGEEVGWRGLMYEVLYPRYGLLASTAVIGVAWGLWHAPLILFLGYSMPHHRNVVGLAMYCAVTTSWTLILLLLRRGSGSVLPAAIMHGTINALGGLMALTFPGMDGLYGLPVGAGSLIASLMVGGVMAAVLGRPKARVKPGQP